MSIYCAYYTVILLHRSKFLIRVIIIVILKNELYSVYIQVHFICVF